MKTGKQCINEAIERLNTLGLRLNPQDDQIRAVLYILFTEGEKSGIRESREDARGMNWQEATA